MVWYMSEARVRRDQRCLSPKQSLHPTAGGHPDGHSHWHLLRILAGCLVLHLFPCLPVQCPDHHAPDACTAGKEPILGVGKGEPEISKVLVCCSPGICGPGMGGAGQRALHGAKGHSSPSDGALISLSPGLWPVRALYCPVHHL